MIRNLKVLLAAAMALTAFGIMSASGAQAAEFHCSVEPCTATLKPDGTAKTAHHVFVVKKGAASGSFTCNELSGEGTANTKTVTEITFKKLLYSGCSIAGSAVTVHMNGCEYKFSSHTTVTILCPAGKEIELTVGGPPALCTVKIPAQGPLEGSHYANINSKAEITAFPTVPKVTGTAGAGCKAIVGFEGHFTEAEYTTGNTIVTGETHAGVMANIWWE